MMDIINATCTILANKFLNLPIYITNSQEFKRPSFYVYTNSDNRTPANKILYNRVLTINIMYFAPKDDYDNPDIENGFEILNQLNNLFPNGKLPVGDRFYTITKTSGGNYLDEILYSVTIEYFDETKQNIETYETMNKIEINYENQGGQ